MKYNVQYEFIQNSLKLIYDTIVDQYNVRDIVNLNYLSLISAMSRGIAPNIVFGQAQGKNENSHRTMNMIYLSMASCCVQSGNALTVTVVIDDAK